MSDGATWLVIIFVVVPMLALAVKLAWWFARVAFVMCIGVIMVAGAAWRGELD